ncbi:hypothetical protein CF116_00775 [Aeromonas veronii]|uniref:EpsG family protein n=1 Tax=Aeromonas veronii TaxID=654 RepID=UPI00111B991A|nr:EpsG family protein [Aeromonas veronii]TNI83320.1 hypothetical protein CF116_00775 [Aeromonas veronii]
MAMPKSFNRNENSEFRFSERRQLCYHFLLVTICVLFITPLISIPLIGAYLLLIAGRHNENEALTSAPFLIMAVFLLIIIFSFREYGFNFSDTSDDVPGYYRWYLNAIKDWPSLLFNREFFFWLPFLAISLFSWQLDFQEFTLLANVYFFTLLYFVFIRFGKYSVAFIFIWFFLFHANIYGLAHVYRQTLALLFLTLSVGGYIDGSKWRFYIFSLFSIFSHNAAILFVIPFLIIATIKPGFFVSYLKGLFLIIILFGLFYFTPPSFVSEIVYKFDFYSAEGSLKRGFDLQSFLIVILNFLLFFNVKSVKIRRFAVAILFIEVIFISVGLWSFLGRINLLTLPLTIYVYFVCVKEQLFYYIKNDKFFIILILSILMVSILYTLRIDMNDLQSIAALLANGEFLNFNNGFVSILQRL